MEIRIGVAGWAIPTAFAGLFPGEGTHLERYARVCNAVEINSTFYRPHLVETYERWAESTPENFRFAVKVPKSITHEARLQGAESLFEKFHQEVLALGDKLGPLLVQLPPSLRWTPDIASSFFASVRHRFAGTVVCEPRHPTWFTESAAEMLRTFDISRVGADPSFCAEAGAPTGPISYRRLHGVPRMYWSAYSPEKLESFAQSVEKDAEDRETWCIFDNTAAGAALPNALAVAGRVAARPQDCPYSGETGLVPPAQQVI